MTDARTGKRVVGQAGKPKQPTPRQCPICKAHSTPSAATFPFCSKRCRLVDLGQWFSGSYAISRDVAEEDDLD